eukprot:5212101-Lingulodinium_polyedra.AAC.1
MHDRRLVERVPLAIAHPTGHLALELLDHEPRGADVGLAAGSPPPPQPINELSPLRHCGGVAGERVALAVL